MSDTAMETMLQNYQSAHENLLKVANVLTCMSELAQDVFEEFHPLSPEARDGLSILCKMLSDAIITNTINKMPDPYSLAAFAQKMEKKETAGERHD